MRLIARLTSLILFLAPLLIGTKAFAGGVIIQSDTLLISGGTNGVFAPSTTISLSFEVSDYEYGSNDYKYLLFTVASETSSVKHMRLSDLNSLPIYALVMREHLPRNHLGEPNDYNTRLAVELQTPSQPGTYQVTYNKIPYFSDTPLIGSAPLGHTFKVEANKKHVVTALRRFPDFFEKVTNFSVGKPDTSSNTLSLYLRANGQQPGLANIEGGLQEKPLKFTWYVGDEFKGNRDKIRYRYRMWPEDDDDRFTEWSATKEWNVFFLPKGNHRLEVEAKHDDGKHVVISRRAQFSFPIKSTFVAKATPEIVAKGPDGKPVVGVNGKGAPEIVFDEIYKKSRALLVGVWKFDDAEHLQSFDRAKIQNDINTLEVALSRNGFEVTKLFSERLSRQDIAKAVEALVNASSRDERVFIYFSTHGFADPKMPSEAYIATSDCYFNEPSVGCLRLKDVEYQASRAIDGQRVRQVLIAVDSCFSGLGVVSKAASIPNLAKLAAPQGAFMLTAGMADQVAQIDPGLQMSTFTHYLAKGLSGAASAYEKNGVITLTELLLYVQYNVAKQTNSKQIPMMGRIKGDGEMLFKPLASGANGKP